MTKYFTILLLLCFAAEHAQCSAEADSLINKTRLSDSVNSDYREYLPVISPDANTLYFCRTGHHDNLGVHVNEEDKDIWFSELKPDGTWSEAKNIGAPLNNLRDNAVCSVTPGGNTLLLFG
ncbi:MAG: hypothetical protein KAH48_01350, partial [Chlorobi bacterium]|nr:hypothetical protein [Chlorobiota bacterium]